LVGAWAALLIAVGVGTGRIGLGTVLSLAFVVQVTPAVFTAYRTRSPSGISVGTWSLVLGELACWCVYGLHRGDRRLALMGLTGIVAAAAMIVRARTSVRRGGRDRAAHEPAVDG
jgi:hypothetical protein